SSLYPSLSPFFFFNHTATTEIYTLSLHDALPISRDGPIERCAPFRRSYPSGCSHPRRQACANLGHSCLRGQPQCARPVDCVLLSDRKSTRLNSSHVAISYAVFCLKKKKKKEEQIY